MIILYIFQILSLFENKKLIKSTVINAMSVTKCIYFVRMLTNNNTSQMQLRT